MSDPWHPDDNANSNATPPPAPPLPPRGAAAAVPVAPATPAEPARQEWQVLEKLLLSANDEQRKARRWGIFFKSITFIYLGIILWMLLSGDMDAGGHIEPHVAVVDVQGVIMPEGDTDALDVNASLRDAFEAEQARAIVLDINSPGGSPVQAGIIHDEIMRLRAEYPDKKVYAVIGDVGASAAYYIAAAADEVYVDKASIVGSIGVIMQGFGFEELIKKLGVESRIMTAGENKNLLDPFAPVSEVQKQHVQGMLNTIHAQFIQAVKDGRGDRLKDDPLIFSGLFWTGEESVQLGLADGLGSVDFVAREVVGIEDLYDYSYHPSALESLAHRFGASVGKAMATELAAQAGGTPQLR